MRKYRLQMVDQNGVAIQDAGGKVYVASQGDTAKLTLYNASGGALTNPLTPTNGIIEFHTADSVAAVDLFIQAPSGHFKVEKAVVPSGRNVVRINKSQANTLMVIPFAIGDTTATTETDTGFDLVTNSIVLPGAVGVDVHTLDASETIDVGILSSESGGDADGFLDGASVNTAASVIGTLTNGAATLGILLSVQDSANAGDLVPEGHVCDGTAKSISYTLSAGTDTAKGYIKLPVQLPYASL